MEYIFKLKQDKMAKPSIVWNHLLITSLDTVSTDHNQGYCFSNLLSLDQKTNKPTDKSVDLCLKNMVLTVQHSL